MFREDIHWGYADLDGEGIDEMLVWLGVGPWCGSAGCETPVLRREPNGWGKPYELFGEFLVGPTAEKLQLIDQLRQRPWCAPETAN